MSPLELTLVFVWSFAVSFAGGLVGLVLGNLRLPLIVLVGSSPAAAAGANVAISAPPRSPPPTRTGAGAGSTGACSAGWRRPRWSGRSSAG